MSHPMPRSAAVAALFAAACAHKPVHLQGSYERAPEVTLSRGTVAMTIVDGRGSHVESRANTMTWDLPDTATTQASVYGDTLTATTTYNANTITVRTGQSMGSSLVVDVDEILTDFAADASVPLLQVDDLSTQDERGLRRAADRYGFDRVVFFRLSHYEFSTDADANAAGWAYLGGLTVGLAAPFIPLERWDATVQIGGELILWDRSDGVIAEQRFERRYSQRGKGLPSYRRVFGTVSSWADREIAADLLRAMSELSEREAGSTHTLSLNAR